MKTETRLTRSVRAHQPKILLRLSQRPEHRRLMGDCTLCRDGVTLSSLGGLLELSVQRTTAGTYQLVCTRVLHDVPVHSYMAERLGPSGTAAAAAVKRLAEAR